MPDLPTFLQSLPAQAFGFMLVIARVGTMLLTGPGFGDEEIPATVRAAMAVALGALVYPLLQTQLPAPPPAVPALILILALEILVGAWLGFLARLMTLALSTAGTFLSLMIGLSSVLQLDPSLSAQSMALSRLFGLAAVCLLFMTGLYLLPIEAVMGSYTLVPPGTGFDTGGAAQLVVRAVGQSFNLSLRLAAPFVVVGLVWQAAMGLISRLVPQIQVHVISAPAQIVGGLALLMLTMGVLFSTWTATTLRAFSSLPGM